MKKKNLRIKVEKFPVEVNSVIHGDCYEVLQRFSSNIFDFVITDPPCLSNPPKDIRQMLIHWLNGDEYIVGKKQFMPGPKVWQQIMRVVKPGGYVLSFADPKMYDLLSIMMRITDSKMVDKIDVHCDESYMSWLHEPKSNKAVDVEKAFKKANKNVKKWKGYETALRTAHKSILRFSKKQGKTVQFEGNFVYSSRSITDERHLGCEDLRWCNKVLIPSEVYDTAEIINEKSKGVEGFKPYKLKKGNFHPQTLPLSLCRYLIKMVMPPGGGLMLDPFCGGGSLLLAAASQDCDFIGIDSDSASCIIANARLNYQRESHG